MELSAFYQTRVIEESRELSSKIEKLSAFLQSDSWGSVDSAEQERMKRQLAIMRDYLSVLNERIQNFS